MQCNDLPILLAICCDTIYVYVMTRRCAKYINMVSQKEIEIQTMLKYMINMIPY
jgi:hypothetical protein